MRYDREVTSTANENTNFIQQWCLSSQKISAKWEEK